MKLAAAQAIASVVKEDELSPEYIIPSVFNREVVPAVAGAVAGAAELTGVARRRREAVPREPGETASPTAEPSYRSSIGT